MGGFAYNIHCYAENPEVQSLDNFQINDNISFLSGQLGEFPNSDLLIGGGSNIVAHSPTLYENYTYGGNKVNVGYQGGATDITLENNYFPEGINYQWQCDRRFREYLYPRRRDKSLYCQCE